MPTVGDYIKSAQDRLWLIFEGDTEWARIIPAGNRIKRTGSNPYPVKTNKSSADFGEADLMLLNGSLSGLTGQAPQTFGNLTSSPPCAFIADNRLTFVLKTTFRDCRSNDATSLLIRTELLLLTSGARLAYGTPTPTPLDGVQSWGPLTVSQTETTGDTAAGSLRLTQKILIPIHYQFQKADILG